MTGDRGAADREGALARLKARATSGAMPARFARYILAGAAGLALGIAMTALMREKAGLPPAASFAVALAALFAFHFAANALFVFRAGANRRAFTRYAIAALAFRALDFLIFQAAVQFAPIYLSVLAALLISNIVKFLIYGDAVFINEGETGYLKRLWLRMRR